MLFLPEWLEVDGRNIYILKRLPDSPLSSITLLIPPFAEEMNKSRHMFSHFSSEMAKANRGTIYFDYFGSGESAGGFEQASFASYTRDCKALLNYCHSLKVPVNVVALRFGALVLLSTLQSWSGNICKVALWHPVLNGKQFINQFFRLRLAGEMLSAKANKSSSKTIRAELENDGYTEIAGYTLSKAMVEEIENTTLENLIRQADFELPISALFEVGTLSKDTLSPIFGRTINSLRLQNFQIEGAYVVGEQFWATQEITKSEHLALATVSFLQGEG